MSEDSWTELTPTDDMAHHESPPPPYVPIQIESDMHREILEMEALGRTRPKGQFIAQANQERERFIEQLSTGQHKVKFVRPVDFRVYAENSVRSKWKSWGLWRNNWGPAWPEDSKPSLPSWCFTTEPRVFPCHIPEDDSWPHESELGQNYQPSPETAEKQQKLFRELLNGDWDQHPSQASLLTANTSRPFDLFLHLVLEEMEWLNQIKNNEEPQPSQTLGARAYNLVRREWNDQGIWHISWEQTPGWTWPHRRHQRAGPSSQAEAPAVCQCHAENASDKVQTPPTLGTARFGLFASAKGSRRTLSKAVDVQVPAPSRLDNSSSGPTLANTKRRRGSDDYGSEDHFVKRARKQRSGTGLDQALSANEKTNAGKDAMKPRQQRAKSITGPVPKSIRRHTKTPGMKAKTSEPPRRSKRIAQIKNAQHRDT